MANFLTGGPEWVLECVFRFATGVGVVVLARISRVQVKYSTLLSLEMSTNVTTLSYSSRQYSRYTVE